ncbi:MAG: amidohydrolase family protein, partial [Betaproteobacteria bacterium]|nr:amidohydrolase family protein [Betaproteobacteria bacterium]
MSEPLLVGPDRDGRTVAIVDGRVAGSAAQGSRTLSCTEGRIAPGAVCAHTHLYSGLAPYGMPAPSPAPENFLQILERVWWRLDRALDAETLRAAAMDYVARALLAGTTALIDHHESPNLIEGSLAILAEVCEQLGMRALLCYGATERNFGRIEAERGLAECRRVPASSLVRGLVGLHACFTVSDDTIRAAADLARELSTVLHVHVAEDSADVRDSRSRGAAGPLERLSNLGALVPGSILAHGVHLTRGQVEAA